ncbi:Condensin complex subunit 1 [Seminavis robusta]|uniref:Condensin complex subunit 1 n=1 Tax=Seminavis robusta TaxID=568900 RepID=A0A9N8DU77_9STRA|nr:Condensin complex subunit 1 [Seminavis robusta]|eukprot:Sro359_g126130.1 Condensin complex subunit 1 (1383) ;mRNA; f:49430-53927
MAPFQVPASLHDLERAPYNLLPYPLDFDDDDEAARADSFLDLVHQLEQGNRTLSSGGVSLFTAAIAADDGDSDEWMDEDRVQALYTLVRKSMSLSPDTRLRLVYALCQALKTLSSILDTEPVDSESTVESQTSSQVMPQSFRDAFACHLYMLFSIMFYQESEAKVGNSLKSGGGNKRDNSTDTQSANIRATCADAMVVAAKAMASNKAKLWRRGVVDESVVILPARIGFQMLESATGVVARKACSADTAMEMIAATTEYSDEGALGTVVAALMDLMHSFEHMAPICAELCCLVPEKPTNRLANELLKEVGRLNTNGMSGNDKASGIRNVAPFISHLAGMRPRLVLSNAAYFMPHLDSEVYHLRSAIVTCIASILSNTAGDEEGEGQGNPLDEANRTSLLKILCDRVRDVSSFTRAATLRAWISVVQSRSLPAEWFIPVTELAIDRLNDKTIMVRRLSMQLLTTVLENNPFMGDLEPERYQVKLAELQKFVLDNLPQNIKEAHEAALEEATYSAVEQDTERKEIEHATLAAAIVDAETWKDDELTEEQELLRNKVQALTFTQGCLDFIALFESANEAFNFMLHSKLQSDVTEALKFYVRARHFKLPCAISGMKNALALMWSTEQAVKDEVRKAFVEVFLAEPGTDGKELLSSDRIAENLMTLITDATVSEIASIEEGITSLVKDEMIPADVFVILWSVVSKGSRKAKSAAMQILSMGAAADRSIINSKSRLKLLLDACLGDYTERSKDWGLARASAQALQKVDRATVDEGCAKYLVLERIMEQLAVVARGDWCSDHQSRDTLEWFSASEEAIKALFGISSCPEESCSEIVQVLYANTFKNSEGSQCHSLRLARFFHVLGNVALNLLCYTEELSSSVKQANAKKAEQKQVDVDAKKAKKQNPADALEADDSSQSEDEMEAELGIAAEVEAETERQMSEITETEILGRGLVSAFAPTLVKVVGNEGGKFGSEVLQTSSMNALCKFCCVSAEFCEKHLPLMFSVLARAPEGDTVMKANTVVALGDLAFRWPNQFEPFTPHLYANLRDPSTKVRRHTLMCLTHLILNDMVKVKGQVCEIALCLQDEDCRIRDMAGLLFHSLASRSNNPIYNLLPDIISQLSQCDISRESFRSIMLFLLGFIKKERQSTTLTEKLVLRIDKSSSISQQADLAYCISQLKQSDKSIRFLFDNFKLYKDALHDEDVLKAFTGIIAKARKTVKIDLKPLLDEWSDKINSSAETGKQDKASNSKALKAAQKQQKKKKSAKVESDSEEQDEESEEEPRRVQRTRRRAKSKAIVSDEEDASGADARPESEEDTDDPDEESEEEETQNTQTQQQTGRVQRNRRRAKSKTTVFDEECKDDEETEKENMTQTRRVNRTRRLAPKRIV